MSTKLLATSTAARLTRFDKTKATPPAKDRRRLFTRKGQVMKSIEMTAGSIAPATIEPQELAMLASSIRAGLNTISSHLQSALRVALQVGEDLCKAQAQVAKGQWEQWLQKNCNLRERSARVYKQTR
jgi:hypothetical protein